MNKLEGGKQYAMSFDFDNEILTKILMIIPETIAEKISSEFSKYDFNYTVEFDGIVQIDLVANLGDPQKGQYEKFIPLVIKAVS